MFDGYYTVTIPNYLKFIQLLKIEILKNNKYFNSINSTNPNEKLYMLSIFLYPYK